MCVHFDRLIIYNTGNYLSGKRVISHVIGFALIPQVAPETSGDLKPLGDFATDQKRLTTTRQTSTTERERQFAIKQHCKYTVKSENKGHHKYTINLGEGPAKCLRAVFRARPRIQPMISFDGDGAIGYFEA